MKTLITFFLLVLVSACANKKKSEFVKEKVCSRKSLNYIKQPRNQYKKYVSNPILTQQMINTQASMQHCYEEFKNRSNREEFKTCMVVGIDDYGRTEFFDFSSKEVRLDKKFLECAKAVTKNIPYNIYGSNFILIQSYDFFYK